LTGKDNAARINT